EDERRRIAGFDEYQQRVRMAGVLRGLVNFFGILAVVDEAPKFERDPLSGVFIAVVGWPLPVSGKVAQAGGARQRAATWRKSFRPLRFAICHSNIPDLIGRWLAFPFSAFGQISHAFDQL